MPKLRRDVSNEEVIRLLEKHNNNITYVAMSLSVSRALVRAVKNGRRKDTIEFKEKRDPSEMCSCCGVRPIDKEHGLKYLCRKCFKNPPVASDV